MSTSAGFTYDGERFERYFSDFYKKYGIWDIYSGGFYLYDTLEEYWEWWSRHIFVNRYDVGVGKSYAPVYGGFRQSKDLAGSEAEGYGFKAAAPNASCNDGYYGAYPTLINSLIERIEVHNNDKSSGHCYVKVDIYFTAVGMIDIPTEQKILAMMKEIRENPQDFRFVA